MKVRILGNSIRLRCNQSETQKLGAGGSIRESLVVALAPERREFIYELAACPQSTQLGVAPSSPAHVLRILIPTAQAAEWAHSTAVGCYGELPLGPSTLLRLTIEKDFACLKPREGEDDHDSFPHPDAATHEHRC